MTEQQLFYLEHEIQSWHAQRACAETPRPARTEHILPSLSENVRRLFSRWSVSAEQTETLKALRLELLRAVASGEISPEVAHRVLSARP
jgi:hypothetical protein